MVCEDAEKATRKYGDRMAELIDQRIGEIESADSVETLIKYRMPPCP